MKADLKRGVTPEQKVAAAGRHDFGVRDPGASFPEERGIKDAPVGSFDFVGNIDWLPGRPLGSNSNSSDAKGPAANGFHLNARPRGSARGDHEHERQPESTSQFHGDLPCGSIATGEKGAEFITRNLEKSPAGPETSAGPAGKQVGEGCPPGVDVSRTFLHLVAIHPCSATDQCVFPSTTQSRRFREPTRQPRGFRGLALRVLRRLAPLLRINAHA